MRSLITPPARRACLATRPAPPDATLGKAEDILFQLRRDAQPRLCAHTRGTGQVHRGGLFGPQRTEHVERILTGFTAVDDLLGGLQRSDLIIIGARPSVGKTSLALAIARNAVMAQPSACVAFFSMEMSRESVVNRLISSEADVDSHRLRLDQLSAAEEKRVGEAVGILSETPFYIDDSPQLRVVEMRSKVRRLHNERGVDMVVLDYLQLVHGDTNDNRPGGQR